MGISDVIADFINELLDEDSTAEVQRSELASRFNCVPSQINYVISTRFSPDQRTAAALLENCVASGVLEERLAHMMLAGVSDQALRPVDPAGRDIVRAAILKQMLLSAI